MSRADFPLPQRRPFLQTMRTDFWWLQPVLTFAGLLAFVIYSTWAAFQGVNYAWGPYLSPMYSPLIFDSPHWLDAAGQARVSGHAWFGAWPEWIPAALLFVPITPAFLILWAPGGFRFTCYYYRGAYYKAFWADPPNCAVGEPRKSYCGEAGFPLILQNIHRWFMYVAVVFIGLLAHDAFNAMWFTDSGVPYSHDAPKHFGIGIGTLVLIINPILLGGYTFGCHSLRHVIGGKLDCMSKSPMRKKAWDGVSCLNRRHMLWAWMSLFWVGFTDFYVRMVASGAWTDWRIIG